MWICPRVLYNVNIYIYSIHIHIFMTVFICTYMYELPIWLVFKTQPGVEVQLLGYTTIILSILMGIVKSNMGTSSNVEALGNFRALQFTIFSGTPGGCSMIFGPLWPVSAGSAILSRILGVAEVGFDRRMGLPSGNQMWQWSNGKFHQVSMVFPLKSPFLNL